MSKETVIDDEITIVESEAPHLSTQIEHYALRVYIRSDPPLLGRAIIPGIPDEHRMRRAMCYFDVALFAGDKHRERLLSQTFDATRTGNMYRAIVEAFRAFDRGADMFIFDLERAPAPVFTRPTVTPCNMEAEPLRHDLRYCVACFRVEELSRNGVADDVFLCSRCKK